MFLSSINDLWQQIYDDVTLYGERKQSERERKRKQKSVVCFCMDLKGRVGLKHK